MSSSSNSSKNSSKNSSNINARYVSENNSKNVYSKLNDIDFLPYRNSNESININNNNKILNSPKPRDSMPKKKIMKNSSPVVRPKGYNISKDLPRSYTRISPSPITNNRPPPRIETLIALRKLLEFPMIMSHDTKPRKIWTPQRH